MPRGTLGTGGLLMFRVMCGKGSPLSMLWRIGVILEKQEADDL